MQVLHHAAAALHSNLRCALCTRFTATLCTAGPVLLGVVGQLHHAALHPPRHRVPAGAARRFALAAPIPICGIQHANATAAATAGSSELSATSALLSTRMPAVRVRHCHMLCLIKVHQRHAAHLYHSSEL
jgi:hypothetical protein